MRDAKKPPAGSFFWQITFPIMIGGLLIVALAAWIVIGVGETAVSRYAEISTVLLIIPVLVFALIPLVILGALVFGVSWLSKKIPPLTGWIQERLATIQDYLHRFSKLAVEPVIRPKMWVGGLRSIFQKKEIRGDEIRLDIE